MENKETTKNETLARLHALATIAKQDSESAKASNTTKKASYKALQDESLYVLAFGGLKAESQVRKMFGKEGEFNAFKTMLSDCTNLVRMLKAQENGTFEYKLKNGETIVASLEKIKAFGESQAADKALDFTARNAWKNWTEQNPAETEQDVLSREEQAMQIACEADGIDAETLKSATPEQRAELLANGLAILADMEREELEKQARFVQDETRRLFNLLSPAEQVEFYREISGKMQAAIKGEIVENAETIAA